MLLVHSYRILLNSFFPLIGFPLFNKISKGYFHNKLRVIESENHHNKMSINTIIYNNLIFSIKIYSNYIRSFSLI